MSRDAKDVIVHVIPLIQIERKEFSPPLCEFTDEEDPTKWPAGQGYVLEEHLVPYRDLDDILPRITCPGCRDRFIVRRNTMPHLCPEPVRFSHIPRNPNWIADIGD